MNDKISDGATIHASSSRTSLLPALGPRLPSLVLSAGPTVQSSRRERGREPPPSPVECALSQLPVLLLVTSYSASRAAWRCSRCCSGAVAPCSAVVQLGPSRPGCSSSSPLFPPSPPLPSWWATLSPPPTLGPSPRCMIVGLSPFSPPLPPRLLPAGAGHMHAVTRSLRPTLISS